MPVDYSGVDAIAAAVADIYTEAEQALLALLTRQLTAGGFEDDTSRWAARKLGEVRALQRTAALLVDELQRDGNVAVRRAVTDGFRSGTATALTDLTELHVGDIGPAARTAGQAAGNAIQALADAVAAELRPVHTAVLRSTGDAYRRAVAGATARRLAGARDTRRAAQDAWAALARQGITGFTDTTGRRWRASTYVEMATRTAVARAAVIGEVDVMTAAGVGMCYVVDNPRECPICEKWENQILALRAPAAPPAIATLGEAMAAGLFHPNCFPGDVLVSAPSGVRAADSRRYDGELVVIHTATGEQLPVTPNHPVLTPEGWITAGTLKVGDHVLRYGGGRKRVNALAATVSPGDECVPTRIGDVYQALSQASPVPPVRVPASAEQFHGDGSDAEVEVVLTDGLLADGVLTEVGKGIHDRPLVVGRAGLGALLTQGAAHQVLAGALHSPDGIVGGRDLGGALRCSHGFPLAPLRRAAVSAVAVVDQRLTYGGLRFAEPLADFPLRDAFQVQADGFGDPAAVAALPRYSCGEQLTVENPAADAEAGRDLARRLACSVSPDRIVKLTRRQFAGHVFNLQSGDGWYVAAGIVVHNCRHTIRPWRPGTRIVPARKPEGPQGYEAEQQQRALERRLRGWRERYAAAFDEQGRQFAAKRIATWSAALARHLDDHPRLPRVSYREKPGAGYMAPRHARTRRDSAHLSTRG